ncbi:Uncharacterised protein [Vibrio cholerae]|nr:Uncharacterised protein [Vibrio cholerae]
MRWCSVMVTVNCGLTKHRSRSPLKRWISCLAFTTPVFRTLNMATRKFRRTT